jgi:hypothetical protein
MSDRKVEEARSMSESIPIPKAERSETMADEEKPDRSEGIDTVKSKRLRQHAVALSIVLTQLVQVYLLQAPQLESLANKTMRPFRMEPVLWPQQTFPKP